MKTAIIILALCMASSVFNSITIACSPEIGPPKSGTWAAVCVNTANTLGGLACVGALFLIVKSIVSN